MLFALPAPRPTAARSSFDTGEVSTSFLAAFLCNRGVGIPMFDQSVVCFCPPQYYGEQCQFHVDRVSFSVQLNFSQSIYDECTDPTIELKVLIVFLFENQAQDTAEFPVRPALERVVSPKRIIDLLYARSPVFLESKDIR